MIWGKTYAEQEEKEKKRRAKLFGGFDMFALFPVTLVDGRTAWLETVHVKYYEAYTCDDLKWYPQYYERNQ